MTLFFLLAVMLYASSGGAPAQDAAQTESDKLVQALKSPELQPEERSALDEKLAALREDAWPGILELLSNAHLEVRGSALRAMHDWARRADPSSELRSSSGPGEVQGVSREHLQRLAETLLGHLEREPAHRLRIQAGWILVELDEPRVIDRVLVDLKTGSVERHREAAILFSALTARVRGYRGGELRRRVEAEVCLQLSAADPSKLPLEALAVFVTSAGDLRAGGHEMVQKLLPMLRHPEEEIRGRAATALGELRMAAATSSLASSLTSEKQEAVLRHIVVACGRIRNGEAVPALIELFERADTAESLRADALWALGKIGSDRAAPFLIGLLASVSSAGPKGEGAASQKTWIAEASLGLGAIGRGEDAAEALRASFQRAPTPEGAWALGQFGEGTRELAAALRQAPTEEVQIQSATALGLIARTRGVTDSEAVDALLAAAQSQASPAVRAHAALALGHFKASRAAAAMSELIEKDTDLDVRANAAWVLGQLGDPAPIRVLEKALAARENAETRNKIAAVNVAAAMVRLGKPEAIETLLAAAKNPHPLNRAHAYHALGLVHRPESFDALLEGLGDPHHLPRQAAVESLALLGDARAVSHLEKVAASDLYFNFDYDHGDRGYPVADAARKALEQIRASAEPAKPHP